jgi:ppGpp synthetase/RelA/SpoT-type nucleotidyltranferase
VYHDVDGDGLIDADDAYPLDPTRAVQNEEVALGAELEALISLRNSLAADKQRFEHEVARIFPGRKVFGRVKTPVSMINKLRRKRLLDARKGLTDIIGMTAIAEDEADLWRLVAHIRSGALGAVAEEEDMYAQPKAGYRAVHFILQFPTRTIAGVSSIPIELQVKTRRQMLLAAAAHTPYKNETLDAAAMDRLGRLVVAADRGDRHAAQQIDPKLQNEPALSRELTRTHSNPSRW